MSWSRNIIIFACVFFYTVSPSYQSLLFSCNFDDYSLSNTNVCGGTSFTRFGNPTVTALELNSLLGTEIMITDISSLTNFTNPCNIPFDYNDVQNYFCTEIDSKFQCKNSQSVYSECSLGRFIRVKSASRGEVFSLSFNFDRPITTIPGKYNMSFYSMFNCPKIGCEDGQDTISIKIKDGVDGIYTEVYKITNRTKDFQWNKEQFSFNLNYTKAYLRIDFSREVAQGSGDGVVSIYIDNVEFYREDVLPLELPFNCNFDEYSQLGVSICKGLTYEITNQATITSLEIDSLPGTTKYITDYTSIAGNTLSNKQCDIPFIYNNETSYFCVLNSSRFICQVEQSNYDVCNLGEFLRVKTNSRGQAFNLSLYFNTPFKTIPGVKYGFKMFSLINCPKAGCEQAQDKISVEISETDTGIFKEIFKTNGTNRDNKWIKDEIIFEPNGNLIYLRISFSREFDQGSGEGVGSFFIDQVDLYKIELTTTSTKPTTLSTTTAKPANVPFVCNFDSYSDMRLGICNGISYSFTGSPSLSGLELDPLIGSTKIVTDYTSIKSYTINTNSTCNIPFQFNNEESYFCVLKDSRFVCPTSQMNIYDDCNLGEFMRVKSNTRGEAFTLSLDFNTPINTISGVKYSMNLYTLIYCPKVGCEQGKDSISVKIKNGYNGQYVEVYNVNGRTRDTKWNKESFEFIASENIIFIRLDFSRLVAQGSGDGVAHLYIDQIELDVLSGSTTLSTTTTTVSSTRLSSTTTTTVSSTPSSSTTTTTVSSTPSSSTTTTTVSSTRPSSSTTTTTVSSTRPSSTTTTTVTVPSATTATTISQTLPTNTTSSSTSQSTVKPTVQTNTTILPSPSTSTENSVTPKSQPIGAIVGGTVGGVVGLVGIGVACYFIYTKIIKKKEKIAPIDVN